MIGIYQVYTYFIFLVKFLIPFKYFTCDMLYKIINFDISFYLNYSSVIIINLK